MEYLSQVEEEIRRAEEYLKTDTLWREDETKGLQTRQPVPNRPDISESRRKEIINKMASDRSEQPIKEEDDESSPEEMLKQLCLEQDTSQTLFFAADLTPQAVPPKVREIEIPPSKPSARVERKTRKQILQEEKRKKDAEAKIKQDECTFKPKTTRYVPKKHFSTGERRIEELAQSRQLTLAERERIREEKEKEEMKECTFHPEINPYPVSKSNNNSINSYEEQYGWLSPQSREKLKRMVSKFNREGSVVERLHLEAGRRVQVRNEKRKALEEHDLAQCSFQPRINPETANIIDMHRYRPIHERISDMQRQKMEHMRVLKHVIETEESRNLLFVPKINPNSRRIAQAKMAGGDDTVTSRLLRDADEAMYKKIREQEDYDRENALKYEFHPKLSSGTTKIVENQPEFKIGFLKRQKVLQQKYAERAEKKKCFEEATDPSRAPCTFSPHIGNATRILEYTRQERLEETPSERLKRLSQDEPKRIVETREKISGDYYAQFKFKPQLNSVSKAIGRASTLDELVQNEQMKRVKSKVAAAAHEAILLECSFHPKINAKIKGRRRRGPDLSNPANVLKEIAAYKKEKENNMKQQQKSLEYDELKDCTFKPRTNSGKKRGKETKPVIVRGLGRFLELKQLKKQQEEEQRAREEKAFHLKYHHRSYTVPKPFKLSYQHEKVQKKKQDLKKQLEEKEMKECTFHPRTMEAENRKLIETLLAADE